MMDELGGGKLVLHVELHTTIIIQANPISAPVHIKKENLHFMSQVARKSYIFPRKTDVCLQNDDIDDDINMCTLLAVKAVVVLVMLLTMGDLV